MGNRKSLKKKSKKQKNRKTLFENKISSTNHEFNKEFINIK